MKKLLTMMLALPLLGNVAAQNVNYRVISDDPRNGVKNTAIYIEPFYADVYFTNITMGWGLRAETKLFKRLQLNADFRNAYFDFNASETDGYMPAGKLKKHLWAEASGIFFFTDKIKKKNLKIVLSSTRIGDVQITRYIMVPGSKRKTWGLRGGVYNMNTAIEFGGGDSSVRLEYGDGSKEVPGTGSSIYTMMNTVSIAAGLHWRSFTNLWVETDYGSRGNTSVNDFYIEALFSPLITFKDVIGKDGKEADVKIDGSAVKNFGWRMGFAFRKPEKWGISYKCEFGSRPGYHGTETFGKKGFILFNVGFDIPFNIKPKKS